MATLGEMREDRGLTQEEVAKALGVDQSTVCLWEKGKTFPRPETAFRLAELLGCELSDIYRAKQRKETRAS